jgi:hypothetical protein
VVLGLVEMALLHELADGDVRQVGVDRIQTEAAKKAKVVDLPVAREENSEQSIYTKRCVSKSHSIQNNICNARDSDTQNACLFLPGLSRLEDKTHPGATVRLHQVLVHCTTCEKGRDGYTLSIGGAVRDDDEGEAIIDSLCRLGADALKSLLQAVLAVRASPGRVNDLRLEARNVDCLDRSHLLISENRLPALVKLGQK